MVDKWRGLPKDCIISPRTECPDCKHLPWLSLCTLTNFTYIYEGNINECSLV